MNSRENVLPIPPDRFIDLAVGEKDSADEPNGEKKQDVEMDSQNCEVHYL